MSIRVWMLAAALATALCVRADAAPLEAYGQLPSLDHVAIAPDGEKFAFVKQFGPKRAVVVWSIATGKPTAAMNIGDQKLRALSWADSTHLILTTSDTAVGLGIAGPRREWFMAQSIDIVSGRQHALQHSLGDERTLNTISEAPLARTINGRPVVILHSSYAPEHEQKTEPILFAEDLTNGMTRDLEKKSPHALHWTVDADGTVVAETDYDERTKHWSLKLKRDGEWKEVYGVDTPIDTPTVEGIGADGSSLIVKTIENGQVDFRPLILATGSFGPSLQPDQQFDRVIRDPATDRVIGGVRVTAKTEYIFFAREDQEAWSRVLALFPNADVALESWSADKHKIVVHVSGALVDGDAYRLVDLIAGTTMPIGQGYDGLGPLDVAPKTAIVYAAADGFKILAYLTLPKGRPPKDLPLIVLPHGGPAARDMPGFDWWSQALASRGYAVLQPQFRGSGEVSRELLFAGFGEFGRKMQTDLSDGVRDLAAKGIIDPKRVCIFGGSYGGYAALAGATLDAGVYRCAISLAGISDLHSFLEWIQEGQARSDNISIRYWDRFLGAKGPDDPLLDTISPLDHIGQVTIPILLIHGRDDTVVPIAQSRMMADALKRAGKTVQMVEMASEDHWLSRGETRSEMLRVAVEFLEANNPPN